MNNEDQGVADPGKDRCEIFEIKVNGLERGLVPSDSVANYLHRLAANMSFSDKVVKIEVDSIGYMDGDFLK